MLAIWTRQDARKATADKIALWWDDEQLEPVGRYCSAKCQGGKTAGMDDMGDYDKYITHFAVEVA